MGFSADDHVSSEEAFLKELSELSHKHGIVIWGSDGCGAPSLLKMRTEEKSGKYVTDAKFDRLSWSVLAHEWA